MRRSGRGSMRQREGDDPARHQISQLDSRQQSINVASPTLLRAVEYRVQGALEIGDREGLIGELVDDPQGRVAYAIEVWSASRQGVHTESSTVSASVGQRAPFSVLRRDSTLSCPAVSRRIVNRAIGAALRS